MSHEPTQPDDDAPPEVVAPTAAEAAAASVPAPPEASAPARPEPPEAPAFVPLEAPRVSAPAPPAVPEVPARAPAPDHRARLASILESLLFVADHPLSVDELASLVEEPFPHTIESALVVLAAEWSPRGIQLHPVAGGWQFRTHPHNAVWVQRLVAQKPVRLTRPQLETLAIVAYRQPITRPEIDEIRGVDSGGTLKTLLDRTLVRILGKKEEPGRPLLYGSTKEFLEFFNLRDLKELPTLREFQELTDEHRAQVEALERAAPPGTVEADPEKAAQPAPLAPLARVELPEAALEEDMTEIDALIEQAGERARIAAEALGAAAAAEAAAGPDKPGTPETEDAAEPDRPPPED